jgi:hypothetical protein
MLVPRYGSDGVLFFEDVPINTGGIPDMAGPTRGCLAAVGATPPAATSGGPERPGVRGGATDSEVAGTPQLEGFEIATPLTNRGRIARNQARYVADLQRTISGVIAMNQRWQSEKPCEELETVLRHLGIVRRYIEKSSEDLAVFAMLDREEP